MDLLHCEAHDTSLIGFIKLVSETREAVKFLRDKHVLLSRMDCPNCITCMRLAWKRSCSDQQNFYCPSCKTCRGLRHGSIFQVRFYDLQHL